MKNSHLIIPLLRSKQAEIVELDFGKPDSKDKPFRIRLEDGTMHAFEIDKEDHLIITRVINGNDDASTLHITTLATELAVTYSPSTRVIVNGQTVASVESKEATAHGVTTDAKARGNTVDNSLSLARLAGARGITPVPTAVVSADDAVRPISVVTSGPTT